MKDMVMSKLGRGHTHTQLSSHQSPDVAPTTPEVRAAELGAGIWAWISGGALFPELHTPVLLG